MSMRIVLSLLTYGLPSPQGQTLHSRNCSLPACSGAGVSAVCSHPRNRFAKRSPVLLPWVRRLLISRVPEASTIVMFFLSLFFIFKIFVDTPSFRWKIRKTQSTSPKNACCDVAWNGVRSWLGEELSFFKNVDCFHPGHMPLSLATHFLLLVEIYRLFSLHPFLFKIISKYLVFLLLFWPRISFPLHFLQMSIARLLESNSFSYIYFASNFLNWSFFFLN